MAEKLKQLVTERDLQELSYEELRALQSMVKDILRVRVEERRKLPRKKGQFVYWRGKVVKVIGKTYVGATYEVEPEDERILPSGTRHLPIFVAQAGVFKKDDRPCDGDMVELRYRLVKGKPEDYHFWESKVMKVVKRFEP